MPVHTNHHMKRHRQNRGRGGQVCFKTSEFMRRLPPSYSTAGGCFRKLIKGRRMVFGQSRVDRQVRRCTTPEDELHLQDPRQSRRYSQLEPMISSVLQSVISQTASHKFEKGLSALIVVGEPLHSPDEKTHDESQLFFDGNAV